MRATVFFFAAGFFAAVFLAAAVFAAVVFAAVLGCDLGGAALAAEVLAGCGLAPEAGGFEVGALVAAFLAGFAEEGAEGAPVLPAAWPNKAAAMTNDVTADRFRNDGNP